MNMISRENAEEQLKALLDFYDIDLDLQDETGKLKIIIETKLIKAIEKGIVEITNDTEEFLVTQNLKDGSQLVYKEMSGIAKVQMDKYEGKNQRLYALLASLSKKPIELIQKLKGQDLSTAEYLGMIFLMG